MPDGLQTGDFKGNAPRCRADRRPVPASRYRQESGEEVASYWIPILIQHISKYKTNEKTDTCLKMTKQPLYFYPDIDIKVAGY